MTDRLGVRAIRADDARGIYPAVVFDYFGPTSRDDTKRVRMIVAANDGGRWAFEHIGEPIPFEDVAAYAARRIRDRFTPAMLHAYLQKLGVPALREDNFDPLNAVLVEKTGWRPEVMNEFGFDDG